MSWLPDAVLEHLRGAEPPPDLAGTRYEEPREIGRGAMGVVWRVRDRGLGRDVALKVLRDGRPGMAARMLQEARILARLEHPGIVPVHDAGTLADGCPFYAMKLVRGLRLDALPAETAVPERLRVFLRACEAVAFAHAHGVVHRDLKPENVMVGPFGEVLVMDWGIARVLGSAEATADDAPSAAAVETAHGTVLGTPGYMAPEQAGGDPGATDARADVHALGGILHFLLAGVPPGTPSAESDGRIPGPLRAVRDRAMAADPAARYASADALAADVEAFLAHHRVSAYREGWWERARRVVSPYKAFILLLLAYLAARVAILVWGGR